MTVPAERSNNGDSLGGRGLFDPDTPVAPPVITGEFTVRSGPPLGDVAYVPTVRELSPGEENAVLKLLSSTSTGQLAVLAYSSLEQLVRCCGDRQPWVAFRTQRIDALPSVTGADVLLWDEELPAGHRMEVGDGESK
jgi:hypothetical protein